MITVPMLLEKIENIREQKGLSVYKLTELSGLSETTIYSWYTKGAIPSITALNSVCKVLDITMSELFSTNDKEFLGAQEEILLSDFRKLNADQRNLILQLIHEISNGS